MICIRYCVDAEGFKGVLVEGRMYQLELLPLGAVAIGDLVFSGSRFSKHKPVPRRRE